ncbi:hypothetical protein NV379_02060 [Paenibacillus sp. N1-5-1-14]|uniref:hypothetical protein n=1 Tax=Paenibacillus radicibacter TaxID=2972488 RepID=UPI002158A569|nr:hypothetical protein [Paenibacillus radicibacter]MCR8641430.1 hypothetical protein [Paenibacillus radicibacter]
MSNYQIKVPVTNYHDTNITTKDVISILEQEQKSICGWWDTIIKHSDDKHRYYNRGYGSHDIGEEYGEVVSEHTLESFKVIEAAINYFRSKSK